MDERPIGVFDSGLGGLTAVRRLRQVLPAEDLVFLGDTGRVPYGARSAATILRYAAEDMAFLMGQRVKAVVVACGTVSSIALHTLKDRGIPVVGVVAPAARKAAALTKNGRIGVTGTAAAIRAGAYVSALKELDPRCQSLAVACPMFVPLIEGGDTEPGSRMLETALEDYARARKNLRLLAAYYGSNRWREDFEADEAGLAELGRMIDERIVWEMP